MLTVSGFLTRFKKQILCEVIRGQCHLDREIATPQVQRPGLALAGYLQEHEKTAILVFGPIEMAFLRSLELDKQRLSLRQIITTLCPVVIVTEKKCAQGLLEVCDELSVPLLHTLEPLASFVQALKCALEEGLSLTLSVHATLVEVFGLGVLLQGDSAIGKSEAALGLIEKGHRLIADDVVLLRKQGEVLEGKGPALSRHILEIRGIGIINVAQLFGVTCVSEKSLVDVVVQLETWDDAHFYDRVGLEERCREILGLQIPFQVLPVRPGRDVVRLLETLVLNYRLKQMGYHSAKEFNTKLLKEIAKRQKEERLAF